MKIKFLGQGFESESKNSVGNTILKLFKESKFSSFTGISAFASEAGVVGLSECIASGADFYETLNLIVGIDQEGTSIKALEEINDLGINSYIFYQKESPIFHPKLYLFEGENDTTLIVGSSNLTARGFFGNVESSLMVEFKNDNPDGIKLLKEVKDYYNTLFDFTDPNLFKISDDIIDSFVNKGIVPTKKVWKKKHQKNTSKNLNKDIGLNIPKRKTSSIPDFFKNIAKKHNKNKIKSVADELEIKKDFSSIKTDSSLLIYRKTKLSKSDAQIVPEGTSPTANIKLTQSRFNINNAVIDQKIYFRNEIFKSLEWKKTKQNNNTYEETNANFEVIILDENVGEFNLKISHDSQRVSNQGNVPTWIHWGNVLTEIIKNKNLVSKSFSVFKEGEKFIIEIE
jgi:HKD family nuclease